MKSRRTAIKAARRTSRPAARVRFTKTTARRAKRQTRAIHAPKARIAKARQRAVTETQRALKVISRPNLLVTFDPNKPSSARAEVERIMRDVNERATIEETKINGIFKVTVGDAKAVVRKLVELCRNSPERFNRTFHWTPIDRWCTTDISDMQNVVRELAREITDSERWKMSVEKRQCDEHERDLITKLTSVIDKPNVDLKDPDKIIKVDILGNETAVALLRRDEFLNVSLFRR